MGGYGSGQVSGGRPVADDALKLDLDDLFRKGLVSDNFNCHNRPLNWVKVQTREKIASLNYDFYEIEKDEKRMVLRYTNTNSATGGKTEVKIQIRLECTYPLYGGKRWWFTCPLFKNNHSCGRRTNKLYSVPGCPYFGCRRCFDLTYQSSNDSHKYDRMYAMLACETGMTPDQAMRILKEDLGWI